MISASSDAKTPSTIVRLAVTALPVMFHSSTLKGPD